MKASHYSESIAKRVAFLLILLSLFSINSIYSQIDVAGGETCEEVQPFCSDTSGQFVFRNVTNVDGIGQIGCMISSENPAWFFIRVEQTGNLEFEIEQNTTAAFDGGGLDVDFIAWGPFTTPDKNCGNLDENCAGGTCPNNTTDPNFYLNDLDGSNIVDCSWSGLSIESFTIPNAEEGEFYILLISNFINQPGFIRLTQTNFGDPGSGSTDCSIIAGDLGPDQDVCEGETVILDATPSTGTAASFQWFLDEGTGFNPIVGQTNAMLTIGGTGIPPISGTYRAVLTDLDGNTDQDDVVVTFHPQATIGTLPFTTYEQCDTDGTEDGFFTFDLQALFATDLLDGQDTSIFEVAFYNSQADADANTNPISTSASPNYTNDIAFTADEIFARVFNTAAPDACTPATTSFELLVLPNPVINNTADYELCDDDTDGDDTNGFVQSFILSTKDGDILGVQNPADFTVTYYENQNDADNNLNPIDKVNPYTNTPANTQPIFVRVTNNTTTCFTVSTGALFNLVVNPLPVVTSPVLLEVCDDDQNGLASFNLTLANPLISADSANETFRFYPTQTDAENNTNEILNPTNYTNVIDTNDSVWARTITVNGCFRVSQVNLEVTNTVIPVAFERTFEECDDYLDTNGNDNVNNDDTDGIATFDFSSVTANIIALFPASQTINLTYYESLADANNAINAIPDISNHRNINSPNTQQIFIRVENPANNTCLYVGTHITLTVNPVPTSDVVADLDICDNDDDGDDTNGFIQTIDLEVQTSTILGTQNLADFTVTYHESAADATAGANPLGSPFTNTVANQQIIFVRVTENTTGCFTDRNSFVVNIRPLPVITTSVELKQCDDDTDGFSAFNLNEAATDISTNFANETFVFYESLADAQNDTNTIPNPTAYTNQVVTTDMVWARAISTFGCFRIAEVTLTVSTTGLPATFQRSFNECDDFLDINGNDNANNDDTDGVSTFDFSSVTQEVINLFPASQQLTVTYYRNQADALAEANAITDPSNYRNIGYPNTQQIFIRVENPANNTCLYVGTHITLTVNPVPTSDVVADLDICDNDDDGDDTNGFIQTIDLEVQTSTILGTQNLADFTVTYHESAADATAGANPLGSPFTNTVANQQTIFVRVTENATGCFTDRNSFAVNIRPLPVITASVELKQCDDDTDGFSAFNLNEAATDISTNFANETFVFYESLADAQNDTNTIPNPTAYTNQVVTTDMVWARAISTFGCFRIAEVTLTVSTTGLPATFQRSFNECDDFLDIDGNDTVNNDDTDGVSTFDFSSVTQEVINLFPVSQQLTVTYYRNQADALAEANAITDPSNYRNIAYPNTQQIYIRVDSNLDNDCLGFGPFITLTVDPVPVANPVADLELCDDGDDGIFDNGIVQTFDLTSQTAGILGTQNPANYTVTYHTSAADASTGANAIANPSMYENITPNQQTIYVRVTHIAAGCYIDRLTFDLIVNPLPVANFVEDLEICDTINLPVDASAQNGFSTQIDLESQTATILGTQDPLQFSVTYHASLADAQAGVLPLSSPFTNSVAFSQIIYVRVFNSATGCANGISNFNVIVNPEPTTENVSNLSYCDDDLDGDDTNGFVQNIDLDSQIPAILGPLQDEDDFTVTFHETQMDATDGTNALTSPYSNTTANQQTIFVRVVNDDTGCVNDDFTFDVIINPLPDFQVTSPQIVCLNGPSLVLTIENPAAIYDYVWTDPSGNMIVGSQITVTSGGLYSVTGTTTDGTACGRTREIQVNESIIATITEQDVTITDDRVDGFDDNFSISIDPTNLGIGDYEYALTNENGILIRTYQDDPLFENIEGGFYTIFVRDKNGCGVAELEISVVQFPKFFTPNNDGINDTWAIKGANSNFFPTSQVFIFNRFGKVVAEINIDNPGWNGTFNGKTLPSDDYWYSIKLTDRNGNLTDMQGNFSLLRREAR